MKHLAGFILLHTIGLAMVYSAWRADLLVEFYAQDSTGLVALITVFAGIGIYCAALRRWSDVKLIRESLPTAGLLGTVIGIMAAVAGLTESFDLKMLGLHLAFATTTVALIGHLWLVICERVLRA